MDNKEILNLIITDINHPGLNGIDFSKAVREKEDHQMIPILFLTMMDDLSVIEKVNKIPFIKYLRKCEGCEEINFAISNLI